MAIGEIADLPKKTEKKHYTWFQCCSFVSSYKKGGRPSFSIELYISMCGKRWSRLINDTYYTDIALMAII